MALEHDVDLILARNLRERFQDYIKNLRTDVKEIAEGLGISRPVISEFMRAAESDLKLPPITPNKIIHLWRELTASEKIDPDKLKKKYKKTSQDSNDITSEEIQKKAIEQRQLLKEQGPDELLIAAGYLPQHMRWLVVSPERYPQMLQTTLLLDSPLLSYDQFMEMTQHQLETFLRDMDSQRTSEAGSADAIAEIVKRHPMIEPDLKGKLLRKYEKACKRILLEGHRTSLTDREALGLFATIFSNEMNRVKANQLKLRVVNVEFHSLSFAVAMEHRPAAIDEQLRSIAFEAEQELGYFANTANKRMEMLMAPVIEAIITCSYSTGSNDGDNQNLISFRHINCGTVLSTSIHAVALSLGCQESIRTVQLETKDLGFDIGSLVKCTTSLGYGDTAHLQGNWVDRDLIKTAIQSLLLAGEKWIHQQLETHDLPNHGFIHVFETIAALRERLTRVRSQFHGYRFFMDTQTPESRDEEVIHDELSAIAKEAHNCLNQAIGANKNLEIWQTFYTELQRIYIAAKLHEMRMMNMSGCLNKAFMLQREIESVLNDQHSKFALQPVSILFEGEKKLLDFSAGTNQLLFDADLNHWQEFIQGAKAEIIDFLREHQGLNMEANVSSFGLSFEAYQSLGTIHAIAGRWLFYLGQTKDEMELACEYFLRSCHYFSRVGLKQRVARYLAIAGRTQVRLGNKQKVDYFIWTARNLVETNLHMGQRDAYQQSMLSEIYLLEGEAALLLESNPPKGLRCSLRGLKGAMWMGLARRSADNLYNIARCAEQLDSIDVESELRDVFPVLWEAGRYNTQKLKNQRLNPLKNDISEGIVDLLFNIRENSAACSWAEVSHRLKLGARNVWETWHRDAVKGAASVHPIVALMDRGEFLSSLQGRGEESCPHATDDAAR